MSLTGIKMYVVIIAPEFTKQQVDVANHIDTECLYELKLFENGIVILRFVVGKHVPIDNDKQPKEIAENIIRGPKRPNTGDRTYLKDHEAKNPFYAAVRGKVLSTFTGMKVSDQTVCWLQTPRREENILHNPAFA